MNNLFKIQGDVLIKGIDKLPKSLKLKKDNVLVHSDSTMHDFTLKSGKTFVDKNGNLFLEVPRATQVVHTMDHDPLDLPKGFYKVVRQREHLFGDLERIVVD